MTYQDVLKQVGWPEQVLVLDFETYFDNDYSFDKLSTIEYIMSKQFAFTGLGLYFGTRNYLKASTFLSPINTKTYLNGLKEVFGTNLEKLVLICQNAKFDITILKEKFGINPPYIVDILDLARHYDARMKHDLGSLCQLFKLHPKGDTKQFKGLHYEDMDLLTRIDLEAYCLGDVERTFELLKILLPMLSNPEMELPLARHTLKLYMEPKIKFDFRKAGELKGKMTGELDRIIKITGYTEDEISGNKSFVEILNDTLPEGESVPMKQGKRGNIPALAKDDESFQELLAHPWEAVRNLCFARQAVKSWPLHIKRIDSMANQADVSGGLLRIPLHYYGAHTGRWSGGEGINIQNLGGKGRAGAGTHPLIRDMRSMLAAPDGYLFAIVDSAQIEARILAWLAGQQDLIEDFKMNGDPYSKFASELFQVPIWKPAKDDPPLIQQFLEIKRGFGKDAILGCGYGMGAEKFHTRCRSNKDLRPLFDSGEYNFPFIERLIKTYRGAYSMIPKFWNVIENMFRHVIKYPADASTYCLPNEDEMCVPGLLTLWNEHGNVYLQLPSGRELIYRHCSIGKDKKIRWHWGYLWGGSITENIVQAIARDLLGWWILQLEANHINVVLHNHDETISLVKKNDEYVLNDIIKIMSTGPAWSEGLPLGAEGKLSEVYCK